MVELMKEKWPNKVNALSVGAAKDEGGTRKYKITVGGEEGLPFLFEEAILPNRPVVAFEIQDIEPQDWPKTLKDAIGPDLADPVKWAKKCVNDFGAKMICLRLAGVNPDEKNRPAAEIEKLIKSFKQEIDAPLIILGCGNDEKDNEVLPKCAEILKGENCIFGEATQDNYKTLTAACLADGHSIIAQSPIDINIAKQLNILISDMGFSPEKIVINPTIGALGYGMEYAYSIMERARLAALGGDKMLAQPFICHVGYEAWRAKEAKAPASEVPEWGEESKRGIAWESTTAISMLQAGADILVMRHPKAVEEVEKYLDKFFKE